MLVLVPRLVHVEVEVVVEGVVAVDGVEVVVPVVGQEQWCHPRVSFLWCHPRVSFLSSMGSV